MLSEGIERTTFSLTDQRDSWDKLVAYCRHVEKLIEGVSLRLNEFSEYPVFDSFDFERTHSNIEKGKKALSCVNETLSSSKGLTKYLKADNIDISSIAKELETVNSFIEKYAESVIRMADYLRDIPDQVSMPDDLSEIYEEIQGALANLHEMVFADQAQYIVDTFDRFHKMYTQWYCNEHAEAFAGKYFTPVKKLKSTPEYSALKLTGLISGMHLVDSASSIDQSINNILSLRCNDTPSVHLRLRPYCKCGFKPGEEIKIEGTSDVEAAINRGIEEAISVFSRGAIEEKIIARISALKDMDANSAVWLEDFFHRIQNGMSVKGYVNIITSDLALLLDEALKRNVKIKSRKLSDLVSRLTGRRLPPERIRRVVNEWLGEADNDDVLIDLGEGEQDLEKGLVAWINDHNLDQNSARMRLIIPAGVKALNSVNEIHVDELRIKKMCELTGLKSADLDTCFDLLNREKRCKAFAWEIAAKIAEHFIEGKSYQGEIKSNFNEIDKWVKALSLSTKPLKGAIIEDVVSFDVSRSKAFSEIEEYYFRHRNVSSINMDRIRTKTNTVIAERDKVFEKLPEWKTGFEEICSKFKNAVFMFVDGARWDIVPDFAEIIYIKTGRECVKKEWYKVPDAKTSAWQKAIFDTDDLESIQRIMRGKGLKFWNNLDQAETRLHIRESGSLDSTWLHINFIDQLIHSTKLPLHKLFAEIKQTFSEIISDISPFISITQPIVLLSDHGFSETANKESPRYSHDFRDISNQVASFYVWEGAVSSF